LLALAALALATLACSINIDLPKHNVITGPTQTDEIQIPAPDVPVANLSLNFAAGELKISSIAEAISSNFLVSGAASYNTPDFKPEIEINEENIRLATGDLQIQGIPNLTDNLVNRWDLQLGRQPMNLKINAGAYEGDLDLGGLALKSLDITDGAADVRLRFSTPNLTEMDSLRYQTGASNVRLTGLANANFTSLIFRSGAGNYRLDFSGELQRDGVVTIESGFSQVVIIVPEGVSAKVIVGGGFMNTNASDGWTKQGDFYILAGSGPTLTINVDIGAGDLTLQTK